VKKLGFSLVFVILSAVFLLGFALDSFFQNLNEAQVDDEYLSHKQMVKSLAKVIDHSQDTQVALATWEETSQQAIKLTPIKQFPLPPELNQSFIKGEVLLLESSEAITINVFLPNKESVLSVSVTKLNNQTNNEWLKLVFSSLFYIGVLASVIIWLFPLIRQLSNLKKATNEVGNGNFEVRIKHQRTSYISDIESAFNQMAHKIQMLIDDNKLLTSAVSHDLRTPIARLRFGIEALEETQDPERMQAYIKRLNQDIGEMESLISVMLSYAKLEQSMNQMAKQPCELCNLVEGAIERRKQSTKFKNIDIRLNVANDIMLEVEQNLFQMALINLINNALEHANSLIVIEYIQQAGRGVLSITDDGKGINEAQANELLKPFRRGASKPDYSGYGMGLAIVDRVCYWHGIAFSINNCDEMGGARAEMVF
jgi:signal transduction histidine kinase